SATVELYSNLAAKGLAVEFTSTSLKAALLNILSVDGVPATTAK
uniref:S-layer protein 1 (Fragments) n=1 Tax=Bacillus thuringiensis subsp. konkukian TaxID=180856 RepID=SLAP1_BACHU|nr:RecName: Full=S-layer protein 1; AltName: Full=102 KDa parasporal endotoxin [[Bacillus thuringiensis] serovar konkukian]